MCESLACSFRLLRVFRPSHPEVGPPAPLLPAKLHLGGHECLQVAGQPGTMPGFPLDRLGGLRTVGE